MSTTQRGGGFHWPTMVTTYSGADINPFTGVGALGLRDTKSQINRDSPGMIFTLPGIPFDTTITPLDRLIIQTASDPFYLMPPYTADPTQIVPLDYLAQFPKLANFRTINLMNIGDFARVRWSGTMWEIVEVGGESVTVEPIGQFNVTIPAF